MKKLIAFILAISVSSSLYAETMLVKKQRFSLENFHTFSGKTIKQVNIGWEAYGTLNADKSNAILITHYFTGNSHAAGKYQTTDTFPGYWDSIIGPGKAIDTNKYYVISSDTLANVSAHDPNVITTGPASINPETGKPYGLSFPVVTIRDFVNVQKALIDSLGISRLHAVVGASMGSMQALEWAVTYPDKVERMVSVIGVGETDAWLAAGLEKWAAPIKQDPLWNKGDYYNSEPPLRGLQLSLANITLEAMHPAIVNASNPAHQSVEPSALSDITVNLPVVDWLYKAAGARTKVMDANHVLYLVRASQLFVAGHENDLKAAMKKVKAKTLFLPASKDLLLFPEMAKKTHAMLGKKSQYEEIDGQWGHLDGIFSIGQKAAVSTRFLEDKS